MYIWGKLYLFVSFLYGIVYNCRYNKPRINKKNFILRTSYTTPTCTVGTVVALYIINFKGTVSVISIYHPLIDCVACLIPSDIHKSFTGITHKIDIHVFLTVYFYLWFPHFGWDYSRILPLGIRHATFFF